MRKNRLLWRLRMMRRKTKLSGRSVLIFGLQVMFLLLMLEFGIRMFWSPPNSGSTLNAFGIPMMGHPTRLWAMEPGPNQSAGVFVTHGEDGLRARNETGAPLRIMTLGDSSIYGHGLSDSQTLHEKLRESLASREIQADGLCGGIPGYSSEQTLIMLNEIGWDLKPDLLIIATLWSDNSWEHFVDREWMAKLNSPMMRLDRFMLGYNIQTWQFLKEISRTEENTLDEKAGINRVGWIKEPNPNSSRRVPLQEYAENLDRIILEANARGIGSLILQLSNKEHHGSTRPQSWVTYMKAQQSVADWRGIPLVKMEDAIPNLTDEEAFLDAMHPTEQANHLLAELIADTLTELDWPNNRLLPDASKEPFSKKLRDVPAPKKILSPH